MRVHTEEVGHSPSLEPIFEIIILLLLCNLSICDWEDFKKQKPISSFNYIAVVRLLELTR